MEFPMRVNKYLAHTGIASRREADLLVEKRQVLINGKKAVAGQQVEATDVVTIKGETKDKQYLAYYKGRGTISHSPNEKEVDIVMRLERDFGITNMAPVGRLDKASEGLIIVTSDGRITAPLLSPESGVEKEYQVEVDKKISTLFVHLMQNGVDIEGYQTKPTIVKPSTKNEHKFNITLTEGKKHQIRRMCAALGYQVKNLKRVRIANIELKNIKPNQYRKITGPELKDFLTLLNLQ
ncbi:MAG: pseudouridine synthase [Patescibacteria group bacterium]